MKVTKKLKKYTAILLVKKQMLIFSANQERENVQTEIPESILRNGEIVDQRAFTILLQNFITENELKPERILIVLDESVTFDKTTQTDLVEELREKEQFLEMVPFEEILSNTFHIKQKAVVIAVNKAVCDEIVKVFSEKEFIVVGLAPMNILKRVFSPANEDIDIAFMHSKLEVVRQYSLMDFSENDEKIITYEKPEIKSLRFILLLSVFFVLSAFFAYFAYTQVFVIHPSISRSPSQHTLQK